MSFVDCVDMSFLDSVDMPFVDSVDMSFVDAVDLFFVDSVDISFVDSIDMSFVDCVDMCFLIVLICLRSCRLRVLRSLPFAGSPLRANRLREALEKLALPQHGHPWCP